MPCRDAYTRRNEFAVSSRGSYKTAAESARGVPIFKAHKSFLENLVFDAARSLPFGPVARKVANECRGGCIDRGGGRRVAGDRPRGRSDVGVGRARERRAHGSPTAITRARGRRRRTAETGRGGRLTLILFSFLRLRRRLLGVLDHAALLRLIVGRLLAVLLRLLRLLRLLLLMVLLLLLLLALVLLLRDPLLLLGFLLLFAHL